MTARARGKLRAAPEAPPVVGPVTLTLQTTPQVHALLADLVASGLFGRSVEDVAERLLCEVLRGHASACPSE